MRNNILLSILLLLLMPVMSFGDTLPDLTVTSVELLSDSVIIGGAPFFVEVTFANISAESPSAGSVAWGDRVYFSQDRVFDGNDIPFGDSISLFSLDATFSVTDTIEGSLPPSAPFLPAPGEYYIIYSIDDASMNQDAGLPGITELNENNNWLASEDTITVFPETRDLPDLVITSLELLPDTQNPTQYRYTIENIGNAPANLDGPTEDNADNVSVQAFLSEDDIFNNAGDIPAGGSIIGVSPLGMLNPGETFTGTSPIAAANPGTHPYLTVKVDWGNSVDELDETNNTAAVRVQSATSIEVPVDIKPGSCSNPLNTKSKGVLPVAVLGTDTFDVSEIDLASIRLEGVTPIRSSYEDVSTPAVDETDCACTTEGPDGYLDLALKFDRQALLAALGQVEDGQVWLLHLTGSLYDGTEIEGTDCMLILKKAGR